SLFAYKLAIDRSRSDRFPIENVNIAGHIVFSGQWSELLADEFIQRAFTWHCLRFLGMGELVLRKRVNGIAQYFTVQSVLGLEVVVYCRLIDVSLGRKRADAGRFIAAFGKQPYPRFQYPVACKLRWPTHSRPPRFLNECLKSIILMSSVRQ